MKPIKFKESNKVYGAPENWDEKQHGECSALQVFEGETPSGLNAIISVWQPTPEEVEDIKSGKPIYLHITGNGHPPVCLYTASPFSAEEEEKTGENGAERTN